MSARTLVALTNLQAAVDEAVQACWEDNLTAPGDALASVADGIFEFCRGFIATAVRARRVKPPDLPDELWGQIWSLLPLRHRVAASHVCRAWRAAALSIPSLWADLQIVPIRHSEYCECAGCVAAATVSHELPKLLDLSVRRLAILLERSMHAPLTCNLDMANLPRSNIIASANDFAQLRNMLAAHSARLVSLTARCPNSTWTSALLGSFSQLPQLRDLDVQCMQHDPPSTLSSERVAAMPNLLHLRLFNVAWDHETDKFPSLRRLAVSFFHVEHILYALRSCPNLSELQAQLELRDDGTEALRKEIQTHCDRLTSVSLLMAFVHWGPDRLASLVRANTPDVALDYRLEDPGAAHPKRSLFCMGHLSGPIHMVFAPSSADLSITIQAWDDERVRTMRWAERLLVGAAMPPLWAAIATKSIVSLDLSWELRSLVLGTHASFPALEHVTITWANAFDMFRVLRGARHRPDDRQSFTYAAMPALSRVTLRSTVDGGGVATLATPMAVQFIQNIAAARRLKLLEVQNVHISGNAERLDALAESVVYSPERATVESRARRARSLLSQHVSS